jgi:transcriptional regulator with XRE-family HTH domain
MRARNYSNPDRLIDVKTEDELQPNDTLWKAIELLQGNVSDVDVARRALERFEPGDTKVRDFAATLGKIKRGEYQRAGPGIQKLRKIAKGLNVPLSAILRKSEELSVGSRAQEAAAHENTRTSTTNVDGQSVGENPTGVAKIVLQAGARHEPIIAGTSTGAETLSHGESYPAIVERIAIALLRDAGEYRRDAPPARSGPRKVAATTGTRARTRRRN